MPRKNETKEINLMKEIASSGARTLIEVSEKSGIDYKRITYILGKHPVIKERIMQTLKENKKTSAPKERKKREKKNIIPPLPEANKYIIIDASICGSRGVLPAIHKEIHENNAKIILTDITVEELSKLEDGEDNASYVARRILSNAAMHTDTYHFVKINKTQDTQDKNIVEYATSVKNAVLFTSDKGMSILAKLEGIEVDFFFKVNKTIYGIMYECGKPYVETGYTKERVLIVRSTEQLIYQDKHFLNDGDEIFTFKETDDKSGIKMLCFKIKIVEGKVETLLCDRIFIKNSYVPYKYKEIYDIFKTIVENK